MVWMLGSINGVEHNGKVTAGWIFHPGCNIKTADGKTVLLVFNRTCTDRNVGEQVFYISPVFRVKHFVCTGETAFFNCTDVHFAHGDQTFHHIRCFFRVRLGSDSLVAFAGGTWFICIHTRDDDQLVLHIFLDGSETADIIAYRIFVVCRTRSDDDKKTVVKTFDHIADLCVTLFF